MASPVVTAETYQPFPRQQEFHRCPAKYRLFGGAAGPGKSRALLEEAVIQSLETSGVDTLLLRRTFTELEESIISQFLRHVPWRDIGGQYNDSKHICKWPNGSTTRFGHCQYEKDVYQYQGPEFLFIGIDELTHFTLKQWQFLTSRNRCPIPNTYPNMAGATNPGNIGHAWVKALFIDKQPAAGMERADEYNADDYAFIRATVKDNPIYADDAEYLRTLKALPAHLRRAFLEGDWDVFAGQYFDIFDREKHTGRPEKFGLESWTQRWVSIDWGFEHPAAVHWHARPSEDKVYTYREFVQNHLSPRMLAEAVAERSDGEKITAVYLSPDAYGKRTAEATIAEQIGEVFSQHGLPQPQPADDDRVGGWMLLYQLLESGSWTIGENCEELIGILPILTRDEKKVEDILKIDGDDAADSARYGLKSQLQPRSMPSDVRVAKQLEPIKDPTVKAIYASRLWAAERKRLKPVHFGRKGLSFRNRN